MLSGAGAEVTPQQQSREVAASEGAVPSDTVLAVTRR